MEEEIILVHDGVVYAASYTDLGDEILVLLPDGTQRTTILRGLTPESAAMTHLRGYVSSLNVGLK
ncbi:hypothetical protein FB481_103340 [Pseudomonas sp. AG1028]|uniref:hypothetical protein n=1 Tax=Pseudomonas sp. AG1028 TaxID=2572911 RepID=UPI0011ACCF8F|nr:hypothetical protein [Pseudomonas sp. AG1028]TWE07769.1 hypothetical protein FB481_103340 [Pseudomonas sp. AG1028]